MEILECREGMTDAQVKDVAYWERNMLALFIGTSLDTWQKSGWYFDTENSWEGFKRVISLDGGRICFHIPDDFDIGCLPRINPNWDGHTTREKWQRLMDLCKCRPADMPKDREAISHVLKLAPEYFAAVKRGEKTFEVTKFDRDFRVGDTIELREYDQSTGKCSGACFDVTITYALTDAKYVLPGQIILGIKPMMSQSPTP